MIEPLNIPPKDLHRQYSHPWWFVQVWAAVIARVWFFSYEFNHEHEEDLRLRLKLKRELFEEQENNTDASQSQGE